MSEEVAERLDFLASAALLHDVGKLVQRAKRVRKNHMEVGAGWLEEIGEPWSQYSWSARYHHTNPTAAVSLKDLPDRSLLPMAAAIAHADHLSASEREDVTGQWDADVPLRNVFDLVRFGEAPEPGKESFFPAVPLSDDRLILPKPLSDKEISYNYTYLQDTLRDLLSKATRAQVDPGWLLRVLEKTTALVPSETAVSEDRTPDISLYDHLRTTAMIAVSIHEAMLDRVPGFYSADNPYLAIEKTLAREGESPFLLLKGDIRGIQRYIYDIAGKGALRSLRARSFQVELLQNQVALDLLKEFSMPVTQILYTGGGHFILFLPHTRKMAEAIETSRVRLNRRLFEEDPRLSINLAWAPVSWEDLKGRMDRAFSLLQERIERDKARPYRGDLDFFLGVSEREGHVSCPVCGNRVENLHPLRPGGGQDEQQACSRCRDLYRAGSRLSEACYISSCGAQDRWDLSVLGEKYVFSRSLEEVPAQAARVFTLKEPHEHLSQEDKRFFSLPWAGYAYEDEIESLLAKGCVGAKRLAVLRMDVDNLGLVFVKGLLKPNGGSGDGGQRLYSLSRLSSLSRGMNHFFKVVIPLLARRPGQVGREFPRLLLSWPKDEDQGRRLVLVYSGGDDLFAIGAWNEVAEFALDVLEAFGRYTGRNPRLTLSGGLTLHSETTPIYHAAGLAGRAEAAAKSYACEGQKKNAFSLFYSESERGSCIFNVEKELPEVVRWFKKMARGKDGKDAVSSKDGAPALEVRFDRSFLRLVLKLENKSRRDGPLWKASAAYAAAREDGNDPARPLLTELVEGQSASIRKLRAAAVWVDFLSRKRREE